MAQALDKIEPTPTITVDPYLLHPLLPWDILLYTLFPYATFPLQDLNNVVTCAPLDQPPAWTAELEMWYRMFHPVTWEILERDNDADEQYLARQVRLLTVHREISETERGSVWKKAVQRRMRVSLTRVWIRFQRIYGLHAVRSIYVRLQHERQQAMHPTHSAEETTALVLASIPGEVKTPAAAAEGTVWCLPLLPPLSVTQPAEQSDSPELSNATAGRTTTALGRYRRTLVVINRPPTFLSLIAPTPSWLPYRLPERPTPESIAAAQLIRRLTADEPSDKKDHSMPTQPAAIQDRAPLEL